MNYYNILGINIHSTSDEIQLAYKRLAMKWHPDRHIGDLDKSRAEIKFKAIQEAYKTLGDTKLRAAYNIEADCIGSHAAFMYKKAKEGYSRERSKSNIPPGSNVKWKTSISLNTALNGGEIFYMKKNKIGCSVCEGDGRRRKGCAKCHGSRIIGKEFCPHCMGMGSVLIDCDSCDGLGFVEEVSIKKINLPAGISNGSVLIARGLGNPSKYHGGPNGDLEFKVSFEAENGFKFSGLNIIGSLNISFSIALLGGKIPLTLPTGKFLEVNIPSRTNAGKKIRLNGAGLTDRDKNAGDVVLSVVIVLPKSKLHLSAEQKKIIRSLDC